MPEIVLAIDVDQKQEKRIETNRHGSQASAIFDRFEVPFTGMMPLIGFRALTRVSSVWFVVQ